MNEYISRYYRNGMGLNRFKSITVKCKEIDLWIGVNEFPLPEEEFKQIIFEEIKKHREIITGYIDKKPEFYTSYQPLKFDSHAPALVKRMIKTGRETNVGPMACVAGVFAELVGKKLLFEYNLKEVIIENGGDIFLKINQPALINIFAGKSEFSNKIAIEIGPSKEPLGICTSSATVGHSKSFGRADAFVIISNSTRIADALATYYCNKIKQPEDIKPVLDECQKNKRIITAAAILGDNFGMVGEHKIRLVNG